MKLMEKCLLFVFLLTITTTVIAMNTHVMKKGDTLWDLAAQYYGDPSLYPILLRVNKIDNPRTIANGRVIIIPDKSKMTKIALEKNLTRQESMISRLSASSDNTNTSQNHSNIHSSDNSSARQQSSNDSGSMNSGAARYTRKIRASDVSFSNILKGPKVSADKLINVK